MAVDVDIVAGPLQINQRMGNTGSYFIPVECTVLN